MLVYKIWFTLAILCVINAIICLVTGLGDTDCLYTKISKYWTLFQLFSFTGFMTVMLFIAIWSL